MTGIGHDGNSKFPNNTKVNNSQFKLQTAIDAYQSGQLKEAKELCTEVVKGSPQDSFALGFLATIEKQLGNIRASLDLFEASLKLSPDHAEFHHNYAGLLIGQDLKKAQEYSTRAAALSPNKSIYLERLGYIQWKNGDLAKALETSCMAVQLDPQLGNVFLNLSGIYKELGKLDQALCASIKCLEIKPNSHPAIHNLSVCIEEVALAESNLHILVKAYELLLNNENVSHRKLSNIFIQIFGLSFQSAISSGQIISASNAALNAIASDWRIMKTLTLLIPPHPGIENFLTRLREELLVFATQKYSIPDYLKPLSEALATQCFLNEFAYAQKQLEEDLVEKLIDQALQSKEVFNQCLAIIACYVPIHTLELDQEWLNSYPTTNEYGMTLMKIQYEEPLKEEKLKNLFLANSSISEAISVKVKAMYEESPYPRYRFADFTDYSIASNISTSIGLECTRQNLLFKEELIGNNAHPKVLIAGCGTGQQLITASRYMNAHITVIDLSATSLAYAMRKAEEYGIKNVVFKMMDLLDVSNLGKRFDVIECSGVLHHMAEPGQGLLSLAKQLEPGGYIKLALYSELARQQIILARNYIKQLGIKSTPAGIRSFRQRVLNRDFDELCGLPRFGRDFYALSECRDLCFHVQEHRFTTESLRMMLHAHGLIFCGFMLKKSILKIYRDQFPDDTDMTSLENWGEFEKEHPTTFRGMYQFWVYKPA